MIFLLIQNEDDRSKVERLYSVHRTMMFYTAYDVLHDTYLAEDAVHQSFLRIINNLDKINENDPYKTRGFLNIICRNISYNIYKENKKTQLNMFDENDNTFVDESSQPIDIFINDENLRVLINTINELKPIYSDVIFLKYSHGLSYSEITKLLNISEDTVRKRIERAKKLLLGLLNKEGVK